MTVAKSACGMILVYLFGNIFMEFIPLQSAEELNKIIENENYSIIFKHNTTCPISNGVKSRLEGEKDKFPEGTPFYILDLMSNRPISDKIAEDLGVEHQSPQILVVKNGQCTYHEALSSINADDTIEALNEA